ncbi:MAG TPA: hypothetical protein VFC76_00885 [Oscillospiraceae bacterium]|nr:hypothetical protein [Oscillospiraceae bacterium]
MNHEEDTICFFSDSLIRTVKAMGKEKRGRGVPNALRNWRIDVRLI